METSSRRRLQTAVRVPNVILCKYCTIPFIPVILIHCFIVIPSFSVYLSIYLSVCVFCCFCQCVRVWGCIVSHYFSFSVSIFLPLSQSPHFSNSFPLSYTHTFTSSLSLTHTLTFSLSVYHPVSLSVSFRS